MYFVFHFFKVTMVTMVTMVTKVTKGNNEFRLTGISMCLNLAPLSPADYVLELTATAGGATETRYLAIRLVR